MAWIHDTPGRKGKEIVLKSVAQVSASLILSVCLCLCLLTPPLPLRSLARGKKRGVCVCVCGGGGGLLCLKHREEQGVREVSIERDMYFIIYYLSLVNPRRLNGSVYGKHFN